MPNQAKLMEKLRKYEEKLKKIKRKTEELDRYSRSRSRSTLRSRDTSIDSDHVSVYESQGDIEPCTSNPDQTAEDSGSDDTEPCPNNLDQTMEEAEDNSLTLALGKDYAEPDTFSGSLHEDITKRWTYILVNGLSKQEREEIVQNCKIPTNCKFLEAPILNLEVLTALSESAKMRDKGIEISQRQLGRACAAIGQVMSNVLTEEEINKHEILKKLTEATKLLTDIHFHQTKTRTKLILPLLDKSFNQTIDKRGTHLFGDNLSETIKNAKLLQQSVAQIKKTVTKTKRPSLNKNGPPPKSRSRAMTRGGPKPNRSSYQRRVQPKQDQPQPYKNRSWTPRNAPTHRR
ncbi:uncharacterized protein [Epargyreus clarus]|uniref:uncharacterized protein isoform X2 n=1 Tax=Epargyreus clarus TaxID=520877 RepID=UPI003C2BB917